MSQFNRSQFALHFSLPLDGLDIANLNRSHVQRVMIPLSMADPALCAHMASTQKRLILRVNEADLYTDAAADAIKIRVQWIKGLCPVDAVVVGCEPDAGQNLNFGAPTWDELKAWTSAHYGGRVFSALKGLGVPVVSAALTARSLSEDELPAPGRTSWADIMRHTYNLADYNGCHLYTYNWLSDVDRLRVKFALKAEQERWHKPLFIDEVGVLGGSQADKMRAYIEIAAMLETHPLGQRVVALVPFVSNGDGHGWPASYILRDPAIYEQLGAFIQGG